MLSLVYLTAHTLTATIADSQGTSITGATVTLTLYDTGDNEVSGQTWPLTLSDQGDGTYTGTIESDLDVVPTQTLYAVVTATHGSKTSRARVEVRVEEDTD